MKIDVIWYNKYGIAIVLLEINMVWQQNVQEIALYITKCQYNFRSILFSSKTKKQKMCNYKKI